MRIGSILRLRFRSLFARKNVEQELDEELRYHLKREIEEEIAAGENRDEARYAALRSIRDIEQRKEECRDVRGLNLVDNAVQDFRYAIRQLRKNPGFACTVVFVLGLGISAAVTIFGFVDAALIKPLPYRDQDRLVGVFDLNNGDARSPVSYLNFLDWKRLNHAFSSVDAYALNGGFTLTTRTGAEQVPGTRVSAGFFRTLGVTAVLGRDFRPGEDSPGAPHTVVLSYDAWQKLFGSKPDVLGKTVTLNGAPNTIIGVLPRNFHFAPYGGAQFWATLRASDYECERERGCNNLMTIARLKNGVTVETASAEMQSIARRLRDQYPEANRYIQGATLVPLRELIIGVVRPVLLLLLTGAGLLLLIACTNVTTLLLARSDKRQREIAVRGALGASFARLFRQFAIEGILLAAFSGLVGLLFADSAMRFLVSIVPAEKMAGMPFLSEIGLNPLTIAFACSLSLLAAIVFAFIPIARTSLLKMIEGLKEGLRGSAGLTWRRFGSSLVVFEVAIALVLMVGAGLLGKSLYLLLHVDIGFNPDHLAAVQTSWAYSRYNTYREITLGREIVDRISQLPGVKSVALSNASPIDSAWGTSSFHIAGRPNHGEDNEVLQRHVSSGYFKTLDAHLIRGRYFRDDEDASKPFIVVVNRTLVNKYFPNENPVGKQIYWGLEPKSLMQIIGVVDDIKEGPLAGAPWPAVYIPYNQTPWAWPTVLVRTSQSPTSLLPEIARTIHNLDPFISVSEQQTMTERIDQSPAAYLHRSSALLVGLFATTALLLSIVGLYGVVAYSVSQRTREIGIRMALGAERTGIYRLILKEAGRLTGFGVALGLACSLATTTLMRTLLFGVRAWDIPTLAFVAVVLGFSALLASYIPARRAASVNPVEALRTE